LIGLADLDQSRLWFTTLPTLGTRRRPPEIPLLSYSPRPTRSLKSTINFLAHHRA
jgi:hypothetical protein